MLTSLGIRRIALAALAAALTLHGPLAAQERPDTARLRAVVATATRAPIAQAAPTAATTVITAQDLEARGARTLADALLDVPGLAVAQQGSAGAVTSMFLRGGESDYVLVLVDGVPANEQGGAVDLANFGTANIDRIEIVRGPTSVLYGSEAVSGVVQIFTRDGARRPRVSASGRAGTRSTREGDATVAASGRAGSVSLSGGHTRTDGLLAFNNAYRNGIASAVLAAPASAPLDARVSLRYTDGRYHFPTDFTGTPSDSNQFSTERRVTAGIELGRSFASRVDARLTLSAADLRGTFVDTDSAAGPGGVVRSAERSERASWRRGADARVGLALSGGTVLTAGTDLEWERGATSYSYRSVDQGGAAYSFESADGARLWNRGLYAQLAASARDAVSLTLGVRHDESKTFGGFGTYRVAAGWRLPTATRVRAAVGTSFKAPVFYERYGSGFAAPNPDIAPERSRGWEIGLEQRGLNDRIGLGATWFDQRFRDMIQYTAGPAGGAGTYRNAGVARARGLEVELDGRLPQALRLRASYTHLRTRVDDAATAGDPAFRPGERLLRRPQSQATLGLSGSPVARATVGVTTVYVGARDDVSFAGAAGTRVRLPSYVRVDAAAAYRLLHAAGRRPALALDVKLENLLDEEYETVADYEAAGRTVLVGVRIGER